MLLQIMVCIQVALDVAMQCYWRSAPSRAYRRTHTSVGSPAAATVEEEEEEDDEISFRASSRGVEAGRSPEATSSTSVAQRQWKQVRASVKLSGTFNRLFGNLSILKDTMGRNLKGRLGRARQHLEAQLRWQQQQPPPDLETSSSRITIMFGFLSLFAAAAPSASLIVLFANLYFHRADARVLLWVARRPTPRELPIKRELLFRILDALALVAIFTNLGIIGSVSLAHYSYLPITIPTPAWAMLGEIRITDHEWTWALVAVEHALLVYKFVLDVYTPDLSPEVSDAVTPSPTVAPTHHPPTVATPSPTVATPSPHLRHTFSHRRPPSPTFAHRVPPSIKLGPPTVCNLLAGQRRARTRSMEEGVAPQAMVNR